MGVGLGYNTMSVFGGLEDNAPDGSLYEPVWGNVADADLPEAEPLSVDAPALSGPDGAPLGAPTAKPDKAKAEKRRRKRLHVTVTRIEPTKSEPIIWLDVDASLPRFRSSYRDVRRTHQELRRFATHLRNANPECFVPALPGPSNSIRTNAAERDEKLQRDLQKWFDRVTRSPLLTRDEEFLYFVEAVTGYVPVVKVKPPATGLARLVVKQRAPPPDDVEELREFRPQAKLLFTYAEELRSRLDKVSKARRELGQSMLSFSQQVGAARRDDPPLMGMWDHVSRAAKVHADTEMRKMEIEEATLGDTMTLVAAEAFSIKETLTNRHFLIRDLLKSQAATREKHQRATQLRGTLDISPERVDDAIVQLEAAAHLEKRITTTVRRVSDNLIAEKRLALARIETDVLDAVAAYTLQNIDQDRRVLAAWETARPEVRAADPQGGLSRLGRDSPKQPSHNKRLSQNRLSDEWSDRAQRAKDFAPAVPAEADPLDRKTAVSMLADL